MAKPFLTYSQQLNKLSVEKKLNIPKIHLAEEALQNIGYFALIGGYKAPFINPMTRIYDTPTSFDDILVLYRFDWELRELTFSYLCRIEQKLRQQISYCFCKIYGEKQTHYLNIDTYNDTPKNHHQIMALIKKLDYYANKNTEHPYLVHQRAVHSNVPLWVTVNALTFGATSKLYHFLQSKIQSLIAKSYESVNEKALDQYLKVLTLFRNVCAHNERLYNFQTHIDFPDSNLHAKLYIPKKGSQYIQGKRDYFGLVIAFRYLLPRSDFLTYKKSLKKLINSYCRYSKRIPKVDLLSMMGMPKNWEIITRFKM